MRNDVKTNIAVLGGWQIHTDHFADKLNKYSDCKIAAVCDENVNWGKSWAKKYKCWYTDDLNKILGDSTIDAVVITAPTVRHDELIIRSAIAKKHIFVEKPAFYTKEGAYKAAKIIKDIGIKFVVSDPVVKIISQMIWAKRWIEQGNIGQVTVVRARSAHGEGIQGFPNANVLIQEESGGGAMFDMGCHACHILQFFLGKPMTANAVCSAITEKAMNACVDDNAISLYCYENGVIGVAETGWVSSQREDGFIISGTKGDICCMDKELRYRRGGEPWICVEESDWPEKPIYPLRYWIDCIRQGKPVERENIEEAVIFTEMILAAYQSHMTAFRL